MKCPETMQEAIAKVRLLYPDLQDVAPIIPIQGNQNFTMIFKDRVVRMPRRDAVMHGLDREAEILRTLETQGFDTNLPRILDFDRDNKVIVMSLVPGMALNQKAMSQLTEEEQISVGRQLGEFLHRLHTNNPAKISKESWAADMLRYHSAGAEWAEYPKFQERAGLDPEEAPDVAAYLRHQERLADNFVCVHGDIGPGNLLFDRATGKLGIIDFSGCGGSGYRHTDFVKTAVFPEAVQQACLDTYNSLAARKIDPYMISVARAAFSVCRVMEGGLPLERNAAYGMKP